MKHFILIALAFFCLSGQAQSPEGEENTAFVRVEQMPEFPGGQGEMMKFIQKNLVFPESAIKNETYGKCYARFIVKQDGSLSNIEIIKGVPACRECDAEVINMISAMPKWTPGKQNGKTVPVYYTLPVNFQRAN